MNEIKVSVVEFSSRKYYMMQYRDPITGRKVTRSTKVERTGRKRERTAAEKVAGKWESELREGRYKPPSRITWDDFRERYENEVLPSLADETGRVVFSVFNVLESIVKPDKLLDLTADRLSYFQQQLREGGRSEATISTYLAHLKSSLRWAVDMGFIREVPKIQKPKRAKSSKVMKGRPITLEEFERMLDKVPGVIYKPPKPAKDGKKKWTPPEIEEDVKARVVEAWRRLLRGLWWSGLRLGEAINLDWSDRTQLCVDMSGKRPMLRILAEHEKGNQDRLLPIAPEFAEFLEEIPEGERTGRVFKLLRKTGEPAEMGEDWVGTIIARIGRAAGVKVDTRTKLKDGKRATVTKYASAHDLRRSFGERWAPRVMPAVLQQLMRHESIDTTLKFYVGQNAQATADVIWDAYERHGNSFGNTSPKSADGRAQEKPQTHEG